MHTKSYIKIVIRINAIIIACFILIFVFNNSTNRFKSIHPYSTLQPVNVYKQEQPLTIDKNLISSDYLLIAYMSTDCDHCDYMMEQLCKNIDSFKQCRVVLVAQGSKASLETFSQKHQLNNFKEVLLLHDKDLEMIKKYKISSTPHFLMYNKEGKNILTIKGETKIENLLKPLQ